MPIYEYRCQSCGKSEETLEPMSAPLTHDCPSCGQAQGMQRQVSAAAFALQGSGWFANGYSEGPARKGSEKPVESTSGPSSTGGGCCGGCACH
ncbi:MAG: zinc ribbon domain-containing protein [Firmicutes bacterium]|nr:zinc ribbon domain-containing protein [Bacillota bacterium]